MKYYSDKADVLHLSLELKAQNSLHDTAQPQSQAPPTSQKATQMKTQQKFQGVTISPSQYLAVTPC